MHCTSKLQHATPVINCKTWRQPMGGHWGAEPGLADAASTHRESPRRSWVVLKDYNVWEGPVLEQGKGGRSGKLEALWADHSPLLSAPCTVWEQKMEYFTTEITRHIIRPVKHGAMKEWGLQKQLPTFMKLLADSRNKNKCTFSFFPPIHI